MDHNPSTSGATRPRRTGRRIALMLASLLFAGYLFFGYFIVPKIESSWKDMLPGWWDLRLMPASKDVGGIPDKGDRLIVVADVDHLLHFRMFDAHGRRVVDTDETKLTSMAPRIGISGRDSSVYGLRKSRRTPSVCRSTLRSRRSSVTKRRQCRHG